MKLFGPSKAEQARQDREEAKRQEEYQKNQDQKNRDAATVAWLLDQQRANQQGGQ